MILVSACLCGINCKYDGGNNYNDMVVKLVQQGKAVPVCPEQLGGLETPRVPREIEGGSASGIIEGRGKVINKSGEDSSREFLKGAQETLKIAQLFGAKTAILKARSPSCGCGEVYDGSFTGKKIKGNGITAELLLKHNIRVLTEENIDELNE